MIRFDDQVAVVTGSGSGLGEAYACLLAARGARVVVHDAGVTLEGQGFDPAIADNVVRKISGAGGRAISCYENIETRKGCQRVIETAFEHFGRLDIVVSNAGWISWTPLEEMTPELLERTLNIQIAAPLWLVQAAFPSMKRQQYGRVVLTTSGRALWSEDARPELIGYAIGKSAQVGLMNALGRIAVVAGSGSEPWAGSLSCQARAGSEYTMGWGLSPVAVSAALLLGRPAQTRTGSGKSW